MSETAVETKRKKKKDILSRLGRKPVAIPDGVKVAVQGPQVSVEGKRGKLSWTLPSIIKAEVKDKSVVVTPDAINSQSKAFHGLSRKLIYNMVEGVSKGFQKKLSIDGVGFRANVSGQKLNLTIGFSHPAVFEIPKGIKVTVDGKGQNKLIIEGNDKQLVGQVAAEIRSIKKPEPYKGTGIRYEEEIIKRKAGKAAVGGGAPGAAGGGGK